jgi:hypothetical protein
MQNKFVYRLRWHGPFVVKSAGQYRAPEQRSPYAELRGVLAHKPRRAREPIALAATRIAPDDA